MSGGVCRHRGFVVVCVATALRQADDLSVSTTPVRVIWCADCGAYAYRPPHPATERPGMTPEPTTPSPEGTTPSPDGTTPFPPPVDRRRADRRAPDDRPTLRIPSDVCPACRVYQAPADGTSGRCIACDRRIERRIRDRRSAPYRHTPAVDERPTLPCPPPRKEV